MSEAKPVIDPTDWTRCIACGCPLAEGEVNACTRCEAVQAEVIQEEIEQDALEDTL